MNLWLLNQVWEIYDYLCYSHIYFLFEHAFHWVEETSVNLEILLSDSRINCEWSLQDTKTPREGASGPRLFLVVLGISRTVSDLEEYSPGALGLPSDPDW